MARTGVDVADGLGGRDIVGVVPVTEVALAAELA